MDLSQLLSELEASLVPVTQHAATLPPPSDLQFERTLSRPLGKSLDATTSRLLSLATDVLRWAGDEANDDYGDRDKGKGKAAKWAGIDDELVLDGAYSDVVQRVERLLEGADEAIEEALGTGKRAHTVGAVGARPFVPSKAPSTSTSHGKGDRLPSHLLRADIPKPQSHYPDTVYPKPLSLQEEKDSWPEPLWTPLLTSKPHAIDPEAPFLVKEPLSPPTSSTSTPAASSKDTSRLRWAHPYAPELASFRPPADALETPMEPERRQPTSFDDTPFAFVDTVEAFETMMSDIAAQGRKELAIDLEHHDLRTWRGLCCLIQLSTRSKDYVIDALDTNLRPRLQQLNKYLADPDWVKVFHGAKSDIVWLQRDFGLYVVGLFDTYHATVILNHPQHSLASLLARFTNFEPDKRYQLADWRIRPIPKEMLHYARADTHFLLDIYDHLRLALLALPPIAESAEQGDSVVPETPLETVFSRSTSVAASLYSPGPYDGDTGYGDNGYRSLLLRWRKLSSPHTTSIDTYLPLWGPGEVSHEVLREVHRWREAVARDEDESPAFVMSANALLRVVEARPTEGDDARLTAWGVGEVGRRRRKEIYEAVRWGVERSEKASEVSATVSVSRASNSTREAVVPVAASLWAAPGAEMVSTTTTSSSILASTSSLFGSQTKRAPPLAPSGVAASGSSFFGALTVTIPTVGMSPSNGREAVDRVHASFMLGGGLAESLKPRLIPTVSTRDQAPVASAESVIATPALDTDHSFVPLSDRKSSSTATNGLVATSVTPKLRAAAIDKDEVIIVSALSDKPKGKKRRQDSAASNDALVRGTDNANVSGEREGEKKKQKKQARAKVLPGSVTPFDYSAQPSILDAAPAAPSPAGKGKGKKDKNGIEGGKKKRGFELDESAGFGRAPRAQNQSKKGNVSRSFA